MQPCWQRSHLPGLAPATQPFGSQSAGARRRLCYAGARLKSTFSTTLTWQALGDQCLEPSFHQVLEPSSRHTSLTLEQAPGILKVHTYAKPWSSSVQGTSAASMARPSGTSETWSLVENHAMSGRRDGPDGSGAQFSDGRSKFQGSSGLSSLICGNSTGSFTGQPESRPASLTTAKMSLGS